MKQVFLSKGKVVTHEVAQPVCKNGCILMRTTASCISAGTETAGITTGKKSIVSIAKEKPKTAVKFAKMVFTRGLKFVLNTIKNIRGSGFGKEMGYSAAGVVYETGRGCSEFKVGQRVAAVGTKVANHAGYNVVPINLAIPVPDGVSDEDAATAALGGIAFQGVRRLSPLPGDSVVVMGLGFIGQIVARILLASGCRVTGIDINTQRLNETENLLKIHTINGNDPAVAEKAVMLNNGKSYDGVIFTAATSSDRPMSDCFHMLRRRGTFVLLGVSGMTIKREDIYPKEIDFRMATSYGPGRYDEEYESKGNDYPEEYVRFTIKRNIEAYFDLIASKRISIQNLDRNVVPADKACEAYAKLSQPNPPMISVITYEETENHPKKIILNPEFIRDRNKVCYAIIGTGGYAGSMHLPNLSRMENKFQLKAVMNRSVSAPAALAAQYHAAYYTVDAQDIFDDPDIRMVMICTRHDSHADYVCRALKAGKDVFVEKPLALNDEQLENIKKTVAETNRMVMVGFNRRFSSYIKEIKKKAEICRKPILIDYSMCAGFIPYDAWVHGLSGGGRIVGEGCHIIDTCRYLIGSPVKKITTTPVKFTSSYYRSDDNVTFTIEYENGSVAVIRYISCNASAYPKERMTVYCDGKTYFMDDYTELKGRHIKHIHSMNSDKGQSDILSAWYSAIKNRVPAIPFNELCETTEVTFKIKDDITFEI